MMHIGNSSKHFFLCFMCNRSLFIKTQLLPVENDSCHNYYQVNAGSSEEEVNKEQERKLKESDQKMKTTLQ